MGAHATLAPVATTLFVLVVGWFALGLAIDAACPLNVHWLSRRGRATAAGAGRCRPSRFLVIVPTIGERTLARTLDSVRALEVSAATKVEVAVVGSPGHARLEPGWHHLAPLDTTTGKPQRLNHALEQIAGGNAPDFDYVLMLDSDTVVASDLLCRLADAAEAPSRRAWPLALQPLVVSAPADARRATCVDAAMHTRWRLGYELSLLRLADRGRGARRSWMPANYAVGGCLAVRADRAARGFSRPCEDLSLGYQLSFEGLATTPVRSVAVTLTKASQLETARRDLAWWEGSRQALRDHRPRTVWARLLWTLEHARLMAWVPGPGIFAMAVVAQPLAAGASSGLRVTAMTTLALMSYAAAGAAMLVAQPRLQVGPTFLSRSTVSVAPLYWTWACVLPLMILVGRRLRLRELGVMLVGQLALFGAFSSGKFVERMQRDGEAR